MKRLMLLTGLTIICLCMSVNTIMAQPDAVIVIEAWSPQELADLGWTSPRSTGLDVVGVGETVYLLATEAGGEEVTAASWVLASQPGGSSATLDSTSTLRTTFQPDEEGTYSVVLDITTATGSSKDTVAINAARYVGVGIVGGASPDFVKGQCAACHGATAISWTGTGHATFFEEAIDGLKSSHYTEECIKCHTVGYLEGADNNGFADRAAELGWTFPDTLVPGNWQNIVDNFPTLAEVSNIQCESCHGPGSQHMGAGPIGLGLGEGNCGQCHEDGPYHVKSIQWKNSRHGTGGTWSSQGLREIEPTDDFRTQCANCHSPAGFIQRVDPNSKALDRVGLTGEPLSCPACHDPHDASNPHQLRLPIAIQLASGPTIDFGGLGRLCMRCHQDRREGGGEAYAARPTSTFRGPHHSNQTDLLAGAPEAVITFGMILPNSTHKNVVENTCVDCHMAANDRDDIGGHSWAMTVTEIANGDTTRYDNVTACKGCHDPNMTSFDDLMAREDHDGDGTVEPVQVEVQGLLDDIAMQLPPVGEPTVDIRDPLWNTEESLLQRKVLWNWAFVDNDHSHGVHNYQFTVALLKLSKAALMYGVLSKGVVTRVADVPNDQGKQVRVTWTRFGGDGISDNPVLEYAIWRKVEGGMNGQVKNALTTLNLSSEQISKLGSDARLEVNGELWDFVGSVPAATMEEYSAVVPTLYDSTAAGLKMSTFRVSGHTKVTAIYAVTDPAEGYSIDNLAPMVPDGMALRETSQGAAITWNAPEDEDFQYFALYRGTSSGFDPSGMEPLVKLTENSYLDRDVNPGNRYYYRLAAVDYSGNWSDFSSEFSVVITSVDQKLGVPEVYSLAQNYPNPFNPGTSIRFGLPSDSQGATVKLIVYNLIGERVKVLVNEALQPGVHTFYWDGRDSFGEAVSSGIYIYRLDAGKFSETKRMILLK